MDYTQIDNAIVTFVDEGADFRNYTYARYGREVLHQPGQCAWRILAVPKSNWANPLDTPPFEAYGVTCGITFTFGGLAVDEEARVLGEDGAPMPGLFAAGELVGGLFYFNYPGGSGLTSGAVFGRVAGRNAATPATP